MALIQINYVSGALERTVPVQVILPVDKLTPDGKLPAEKKFKTLYLLHGFLGNYTDWVSGTRIQRWAEERDLCVVMPSGDNAFYVDHPATGNCYGRFIGEELVEITLNNDVLKVDGNMAIAWSGSLDFTVERSGKSLIGSAASGEGLVNVYRGTGKVLLAPVTKGIA